ncbi:hypothetical protein [Lewinella sp. 4G2]|uniref:hypothetical protein n=1 Tax=Lewinella sp. 4G2 TaxID=1803372 RepID=UPI0007E1B23D|nr:hypothetical protein [Lewinella sp. 4G2]OAV45124.1 hypothetical protein A3850_011765 [Lewinella sp. 4G2]
MNKSSQGLASLALFRELYEAKTNVYEVIKHFVLSICKRHNLYQFSEFQVGEKLNSDYGFDIPIAVVKTSIKRIKGIERNQGKFILPKNINIDGNNNKLKSIGNTHEVIFNRLVEFIQIKTDEKLDEKEKQELINGFTEFLLEDSTSSKYASYIGAFVLECSQELSLFKQMQRIKEGVILYSGLRFNTNLNELGQWKKPILVFLDTEILFHAQGLNGKMFTKQFNDFYDFVKEINSIKKLVKLCYFPETKREVEHYFATASLIVREGSAKGPMKPAMAEIVNGCENKADVLIKESSFFERLKGLGIYEDDYENYYNVDHQKFNIASTALLTELQKKSDNPKLERAVETLNKISIRRGEKNPVIFDNSGYVLLTGNRMTLNIAWDEEMRPNHTVPLATNLTFITSRFWFKLNKGFTSSAPSSFSVINNAQILLSSRLNDSVSKTYQMLKNQHKAGTLSDDQVISAIVKLRTETRKPEDILVDEVNDILDTIKESDISKYVSEKEQLEIDIRTRDSNINFLEEKSSQLQNENLGMKAKFESSLKSVSAEKRKLLKEKEERLKILNSIKVAADIAVEDWTQRADNLMISGLVIYILVLIGAVVYFGWDIMEPVTYLMGAIGVVGLAIYLIKTGRNFNVFKTRDKYLGVKFEDEYKKRDFNLKSLEDLKSEIDQLKNELE